MAELGDLQNELEVTMDSILLLETVLAARRRRVIRLMAEIRRLEAENGHSSGGTDDA